MRGIVVSTPVAVSGNGFSISANGLDPQLLRMWLLFWDKIDHPDSNIIGFSNTPDAEFLLAEGTLQRTRIEWTGGLSNGDAILKPHMATYRHLDVAQPGTWSLATGPNTLELPNHESEEGRGLFVKLIAAVPVPNVDVPLEEILSFKKSRQAELDALHHHIQQLYQSILSAPDRPLAEREELTRLGRAVADHLRVSREIGLRSRLTDLVANFDILGGVAGFEAAQMASLNLSSSIVALGAGAGVGIGAANALKGRKRLGSPFGYVASFYKELFPYHD